MIFFSTHPSLKAKCIGKAFIKSVIYWHNDLMQLRRTIWDIFHGAPGWKYKSVKNIYCNSLPIHSKGWNNGKQHHCLLTCISIVHLSNMISILLCHTDLRDYWCAVQSSFWRDWCNNVPLCCLFSVMDLIQNMKNQIPALLLTLESSGSPLSLQSYQYNFTFLLTTGKIRFHIPLPFTLIWPDLSTFSE